MVIHYRKNRLFRNLQNADDDIESHSSIVFATEILELIEECNQPIQRIKLATHLCIYLAHHPGVMQKHSDFRETTRQKAQECFDEAEICKMRAISDQEGGECDQELFDAAESFQRSAKMLQYCIASL